MNSTRHPKCHFTVSPTIFPVTKQSSRENWNWEWEAATLEQRNESLKTYRKKAQTNPLASPQLWEREREREFPRGWNSNLEDNVGWRWYLKKSWFNFLFILFFNSHVRFLFYWEMLNNPLFPFLFLSFIEENFYYLLLPLFYPYPDFLPFFFSFIFFTSLAFIFLFI